MNSSVWRDVRSRNRGRSGSRDMIVGLRDGNRIWRVSPDRVTIIWKRKMTTYSLKKYKKITDLGGPLTSKLIQDSSKRFHHPSLEISFRKGRITFTALSAVVSKARSVRGQALRILSASLVSLVLFGLYFTLRSLYLPLIISYTRTLLTHAPSPFLHSCSDPAGCHGLYLGPSIIFWNTCFHFNSYLCTSHI